MRDGLADLDDVRLYFRDSGGAGQPVVFLHAATGSAFVWEHQERAFAGAGYRTIAYSRRGHEKSERGPADRPGSAADDLRRLLAYLDAERPHLIAVAGGGAVALDFAISFPGVARSLVISGSMFGIEDEDYRAVSDSLRPRGFNDMPPEFRELGPSYRASDAAGVARWKKLEHEAVTVPRVRQGQTSRITWAALAGLRVPALLLTGDADLFTPPAILRMVAERFPGAESAVVPDCGHAAHWEQPETFNLLALEFLGRHMG